MVLESETEASIKEPQTEIKHNLLVADQDRWLPDTVGGGQQQCTVQRRAGYHAGQRSNEVNST